MKKKYVCPYCYKENKITEVDFRCTSKRCKDVEDVLLAKYWGESYLYDKVAFSVKQIGWKRSLAPKCPECGRVTYKRLCPHCHNELPEHIDESNDRIISIVGSVAAGKSTYVGVLIDELRTRVMPKRGGIFRFSGDGYEARYASFFKQGRLVPSTMPRKEKESPIICELAIYIRNKFNCDILTLYDGSGEREWESMPYLPVSQGIIFLLDPMQIMGLKERIDEELIRISSGGFPFDGICHEDMISDMATFIRAGKKMKAYEKINIPLAVVCSKFDVLKNVVDESSCLWEMSPHAKAFDEADLRQVNDEMKQYLCAWGEEKVVNTALTNFSDVVFLPCSALGSCPKSYENIPKPNPVRIEDALLWMLNKK